MDDRRILPVYGVTARIRKDELLRLLLEGFTTREAANKLKCHVVTIRTYIRQSSFQEELKALSAEVWARVDEELTLTKLTAAQQIEELSERALAKLGTLIDSEDDRVAAKVASDILDRNPETSRHHKVENNSKIMIINPAQLAHAAATALEIGAPVVDQTLKENEDVSER